MPSLPTGTVTFLFTDIEGSTQLLGRLGDSAYAHVLTDQRRLLRAAFETGHGHEIETQGDGFLIAFQSARDAVLTALAAQRAIAAHPWPDGVALRIRMGLDTAEATLRGDAYAGLGIHRAARICSAGWGGQILLSRTTADLLENDLPESTSLRALGEHRLKDLQRPEKISQLLHADLPADFPPLRSLDSLPNNLPRQLTSFIGREREMAEVRRWLSATPLLMLTGSGGCGKTRLALQVAADLVEEFADGVWMVDLAPLSDPALVPQTVASALHVREQPGRPILATLSESLQPRHLLLVLDNCEHLVAACAQLAETLLRVCPHLRILATSQEPLRVAGETTWRVPSLSLPDLLHLPPLEHLTQYEAVRLFIERAVAALPDFTATNRNAPPVAQVCHRLDGIPLAIELAAARVKVLSVEQIAQRLDDRFRLLTGGSRTALPRQQTLRATMDWSYDLLSEAERFVLRRLSVFAGGWTLEAAEAICAGDGVESSEILDVLTRLVDKSLVMAAVQEGAIGEARYWLLETVRQYGAEVLQEAGEAPAVRRRHLDFFLGFAERAEPELQGSDQVAWLNRLEMEHDNMRAALKWSKTAEAVAEAALGLAGALWWFWFMRGYLSEGRDWLEGALATGGPISARSKALNGAALLGWRQRDYVGAATLGGESLVLCREAGDERGLAFSLNILALVARDQGDVERAGALHEESLALFRKVGDRWGIALSLENLGFVAHRQGDYVRAARLCEESLALFRRVGDKWGIATSLYILGRVALRQGDYGRAATLSEESLALFRELGDKRGIAFSLDNLGLVADRQRSYDRATPLLEESLALFRELGDKRGIADSIGNLGMVASNQGNYEKAGPLYKESLTLRRELGDKQGIAECLEGLAAIAEGQKQLERAARLFGVAAALRHSMSAPLPQVDRAGRDRLIAAARARLGDEAFATEWALGWSMTLDQAVEYASAVEIG